MEKQKITINASFLFRMYDDEIEKLIDDLEADLDGFLSSYYPEFIELIKIEKR